MSPRKINPTKTKNIQKSKALSKIRGGAKHSHLNSVLNKQLKKRDLMGLVELAAKENHVNLNKNNSTPALKLRVLSMAIAEKVKSRWIAAKRIVKILRKTYTENVNKKFFSDKKIRKANKCNILKKKLDQRNKLIINAILKILIVPIYNKEKMQQAVSHFFPKNKNGNFSGNQKPSRDKMTRIFCLPRQKVEDLKKGQKQKIESRAHLKPKIIVEQKMKKNQMKNKDPVISQIDQQSQDALNQGNKFSVMQILKAHAQNQNRDSSRLTPPKIDSRQQIVIVQSIKKDKIRDLESTGLQKSQNHSDDPFDYLDLPKLQAQKTNNNCQKQKNTQNNYFPSMDENVIGFLQDPEYFY